MKLVIHDASRRWCGNEQQAILLARAVTRLGHEVVFACHPRGLLRQRVDEEGFRAAPVGPRGPLDLWSAGRFAAWLRRERPDAVLLVSPQRVFWGAVAARMARVPRTLVRIGTVRPDGTSLPPTRAMRWTLPRYVDTVIANGEDVRAALRRDDPSLRVPGRVELIANRVELPAHVVRTDVHAELGLPPRIPVIVAVAVRLQRYKRVDRLIGAVARLRSGAHLLVVGDSPDRDRLRAVAEAAGVGARVHLLGFRTDVRGILAAAEVFASSSHRDSMANAMLEAMAAGTLVVATEVGGVREALGAEGERPAAGWIVPVDDEGALVAALEEALEAAEADSPLARERRAEARARVHACYDAGGEWPEVERILFGGARTG